MLASVPCSPKGLHSLKGNSQESSVDLRAEVWVQRGKVLVGALPMQQKWRTMVHGTFAACSSILEQLVVSSQDTWKDVTLSPFPR